MQNYIKLIINLSSAMKTQKNQQPFKKKYGYNLENDNCQQGNSKFGGFDTPNKVTMNTIESKHTQADIYHANFSIESSRIAEEMENCSNQGVSFEDILRRKMEHYEFQTSKLLQKKEREIYFLTIQLKNYDLRLQQGEEINKQQQKQLLQRQKQIQRMLSYTYQLQNNLQITRDENHKLRIQNEKLKQSLDTLILQKNQREKYESRKNYQNAQNNHTIQILKKEVEELRIMVAEMEKSIQNCPSCFTLKRQNSDLKVSYQSLQSIYSELTHTKQKQQKQLLQNITSKIQQNQNITRENTLLKQTKSTLKQGRQKFKQSVAKRCRTLTDQS